MLRNSKLIGVCIFLVALTAPVGAATYIVDGTNAHASDTNPGTASLPFKTIQQGANVAQAGDIVLIESGTYAESIKLPHSGTLEHPIVFQAAVRHGVTIVAPDDHTSRLFGTQRAPDGRLLANYITTRGIIFGHTPFAGWGNTFTSSVGGGHGNRVEDCVIQDNQGIAFGNGATYDCNDETLLRTIIEGCYCGGAGGGGADDSNPLQNWHIVDCIFRRNNPEGLDPDGYNGANKFLYDRNLVMDGDISYDNNGSGTWFDTGAIDFVVKNCTFFGNHAGYERNPDGSLIGEDESDAGAGFMCEANQGPGIFENDVFYSNLGDGLQDNDSGSKGAITIRNNWFVDNHVRGIVFRGMADMNADYGNVDRKSLANIIEFEPIGTGGNYGSWANDDRTVSWSGGTPTPVSANDHGFIWQNAYTAGEPSAGWRFTVPADSETRTFTLFVGGNDSQMTLTAHLSDGSAPDYTVSRTYAGVGMNIVTLAYHAAGPSQNLTVDFVKSGFAGNRKTGSVDLVAAWLSQGGDAGPGLNGTAADPTGPYDLTALGTLDWLHPGRVSYGGDRLLGAALVTSNVFKDNGQPWGTALEQRVLATPAAMGSVIDDNVYDVPPGNTSSWGWWKPTNMPGIAATGLSDLQAKLGVETHGQAKQVPFRGPLINVYTYPTKADAESPDPAKLQEVPSQAAELLTIDQAIADAHAAVGGEVEIPVFGHTPIVGVGKECACQVYDLQARYVSLSLPNKKTLAALESRVTPYAIIAPTYLKVRLTHVAPYEVDAILVP